MSTSSFDIMCQVFFASASDSHDTVSATASSALQRACILNPESFASWLPLLFASPKTTESIAPHSIVLLIVCVMKCGSGVSDLQQLGMLVFARTHAHEHGSSCNLPIARVTLFACLWSSCVLSFSSRITSTYAMLCVTFSCHLPLATCTPSWTLFWTCLSLAAPLT